jgi:drug/metabolite transporter (DMT)-like permease
MLLGDVAGLGSALCWAWGGVLGRLLTARLGVLATAGWRSLVAAALGFGVAFALGRGDALSSLSWALLAVFLVSTVLMLGGELSFLAGLKADLASRVFSVASSGYIFLSLVLSALFTRDGLPWTTAVGGVLVAAGIAFLFSPAEAWALVRGVQMGGLGYGLAAALFWSLGSLGFAWVVRSLDVFLAHAMRMALIALLLSPLFLYRRGGVPTPWADQGTMVLLGLGALTGYGSGLLFLVALRYTTLGNAVVLSSVAPLFVVPIARLVGKERVTWRLWAGVVAMVAGIWAAFAPAL